MTLAFFELLSKSNVACNSLVDIKLQIAKYFIFILLQPKLNAKESSLAANKILDFINCLTSHVSKMLKFVNSFKSICVTALDFNSYDDKNSSSAKVLKLLGLNLIFSQYANLLSNLYLVEAIVKIGFEWHLYTSMKTKQVCNILYLTKKNSLYFFLSHIASLDKIANHFGRYLSALSVNLKSVRCSTYSYLNKTIYLGHIECIFVDNYNYSYRPSKQSIANLIDAIKQKLYHKNAQGYWRASNHICSYQALLAIEKILQSWLSYYSGLLSNMQVLRINQIADYVLYRWQVK